jgi:hypothetical protein
MPVEKRELREALRLGTKTLILQEVRLLRLERTFTPHVIIEQMSQSIQETKKRIVKMAKPMPQKERTVLLKKMIREALDEEIDRGIQLRKVRCIRCLHGRFYDEAGTAHQNLPIGTSGIQAIGCDRMRPALRKECRRFVEQSMATSFEDYLNELTLLYEFSEVLDRIEEVWKDYLSR